VNTSDACGGGIGGGDRDGDGCGLWDIRVTNTS